MLLDNMNDRNLIEMCLIGPTIFHTGKTRLVMYAYQELRRRKRL